MLVVTANWAYTDGTLVAAGAAPRAARAWLRRVRLAAIHAGFGRDAAYRPPASLDVVLAGDTCDVLVSSAWCGRERPWHGGARAGDARRRVLLGCARRAAPLLSGLARLVRRGLEVPAADHRHRPSGVTATRVPVRVALLVGDRDRHLADVAADIAARGAVVGHAWGDGTVLVRHGHEHDPACHVDAAAPADDRPPTLAESLAVDLVARFAAGLDAAAMPRRAVASLVEALAGAAAVDIPVAVAAWGSARGRGAELDDAGRQAVVNAWRRAVDAWVRVARRAPPDCGLPASPVEELAAWFIGAGTGRPPRSLAPWFDHGRPVAEAVARGHGNAQAVVLGHPLQGAGIAAPMCLGRPVVRPWRPTSVVRSDGAVEVACVDASPPPAGPVTIACRHVGTRLEWRRITGVDGTDADAAAAVATVVDAA